MGLRDREDGEHALGEEDKARKALKPASAFDFSQVAESAARLVVSSVGGVQSKMGVVAGERLKTIFSKFSIPAPKVISPVHLGFSSAAEVLAERMAAQHSSLMDQLRVAIQPLIDFGWLDELNRSLLPPNLRTHAGEIRAFEVHEFVEQEGIPLYFVPRGEVAVRFLTAKGASARRKVLDDCYDAIVEDCTALLDEVKHSGVGEEVAFTKDGIGAMRAGFVYSAQAMFTLTLDTLIRRLHPEEQRRRRLTKRDKGASPPEVIEEMGFRSAMVWLPVWNAHETFWSHKGDAIPRHYSRHASVHSVSTTQFERANCVQALMLVTSLVAYAAEKFPKTENLGGA